jgi:hypothetical protein
LGQRNFFVLLPVRIPLFLCLNWFIFLLQLNRETKDGDVAEKIVVYQHANKEVKTVPREIELLDVLFCFLFVFLSYLWHLQSGFSCCRSRSFVIINALFQNLTVNKCQG